MQLSYLQGLAEWHHALDTGVNLVSVVVNGFLLYLIMYHSQHGMRAYQALLAVDAAFDLCLSLVTFVAQPVFLNAGGYFAFSCNGFFASLSRSADAWKMTLFTWTFTLNMTFIPAQFVYRYVLLCFQKKPDRGRRIACGIPIAYLSWNAMAMFIGYSMCHSLPDFNENGLHAFELNQWSTLDLYGRQRITMGSHIISSLYDLVSYKLSTEWRLQSWIALWTSACVVASSIVFYCEYKIFRHFRAPDLTHSRTKVVHKEFHRALLAMAIVPLGTTSVPIMYYMYTSIFGVISGPYSAFIGISVSSITLFNPLTTIFLMRCYREVVLGWTPCRRRKKNAQLAAGTQITGLSMDVHPATQSAEATTQSSVA